MRDIMVYYLCSMRDIMVYYLCSMRWFTICVV